MKRIGFVLISILWVSFAYGQTENTTKSSALLFGIEALHRFKSDLIIPINEDLAIILKCVASQEAPPAQVKKDMREILILSVDLYGFRMNIPRIINDVLKSVKNKTTPCKSLGYSLTPEEREAIKQRVIVERELRAKEAEKALILKLNAEKKAERLRKENLRLEQEKLKMRSVEQCSKGWEARKPGRISGAFGINFGCKFNTEISLGEHALTDGTPMYLFEPKSKFRSFSRYYVLITPKTHQVYGIWGMGDVENTKTGQKEQAVILSILEKKYGKRKDSGIFGSLYDAESIVKGDKSIIVKVTGFTDTTLEVRYYDDTLRKLAEKERIEIESSKVDDSGF